MITVDDFDVVVDVLQKHRDRLWDMNNLNMNSEFARLNIMDDIRFYQIEQLDAAIAARKKPTKILGPNLEEVLNSAGFYRKKEWVGLTDEEIGGIHRAGWSTNMDFARAIEAKLKEKNGFRQ